AGAIHLAFSWRRWRGSQIVAGRGWQGHDADGHDRARRVEDDQTDGTAALLETGWAQLTTSFAVGGTAIFGAQMPGQPDSQAAGPIIAGGGDKFLLSFDGSAGFGTGVAFANPSATEDASIAVTFRDVFGQQIGPTRAYVAPANGHTSVVLPVNTRGVAEIASP